MSDQIQPPAAPGSSPDSGGPHRPASVTLRRREQEEGMTVRLDPANQSLFDALRITFRLLMLAMMLLGVLYLFSGVETIRVGQSGVRLLFGRNVASDLPPGIQFSAPFPFGEIVKVNKGTETLDLRDSFWPHMSDEDRRKSLQEQRSRVGSSLRPGYDGSLITADGNIAHTQWTITYERSDPSKNVQNVLPEDEPKIIKAAVERGVVHAIAQITIDDLLKQSASDAGTVATQATEVAQATLDRMGSGIRIQSMELREKIAPLQVRAKFEEVQNAQQAASDARQEAETKRAETLNEMAGAAAPYLIRELDAYEAAIDRGADQADLDAILDRIDRLTMGEPVQIGDELVQGAVSGKVTQILNDARLYNTQVVNSWQARLARFQAKQEQFESNPLVTIQGVWADALRSFYSKDNIHIIWLPPGAEIVQLDINRDPEQEREQYKKRRLKENEAARQERLKANRRSKFEQPRGVAPSSR